MEKAKFENDIKDIIARNERPFIIVRLRNATFYIDNYSFRIDRPDEVNFIWKNDIIGHCELKSIIYVF
jgi:hypothetical protein